jgi:hypothetical protein
MKYLVLLIAFLPTQLRADEPLSLPFEEEETVAPSLPGGAPQAREYRWVEHYFGSHFIDFSDLNLSDRRGLTARGYLYPLLSKAEDLHQFPQQEQSLASFVLPFPSVTESGGILLLGGTAANLSVDGFVLQPAQRRNVSR